MSNLNVKFSIESAMEASKNNSLKKWVIDLLLNEESYDLAEKINSEKTVAVDMVNFPLSLLKKIQGPEENETHRQSPDVWEGKVRNLADKYGEGYRPAPLIVTDFWNHFEIADGNHRHEALERHGVKSYWTIFFIKHKKGKEYLDKLLKDKKIDSSGML